MHNLTLLHWWRLPMDRTKMRFLRNPIIVNGLPQLFQLVLEFYKYGGYVQGKEELLRLLLR